MFCKAIIIDRSLLAVNMYKLLLKSVVSTFLVARRYEEARPWFFRRNKIGIAVFNSNTFGKKFDEYFRRFGTDEPLEKVPKVFVCRESEDAWAKKLKTLPNSAVIMRPFHPDMFLKICGSMLKKAE